MRQMNRRDFLIAGALTPRAFAIVQQSRPQIPAGIQIGDPLQDRRRIALQDPADAEELDDVEPALADLDLRDP